MAPVSEGGRRKTAFLLSGAFALAAIAVLLVFPQRTSATGDSMIGIDMSPGTGTSSADIATCAQVQRGDSFDADVFVSNAQKLVHWELRVDFNPDVVSVESADFGYLLTQSGGGVRDDFEIEAPGRRYLDAAEPHGDSGSGVLARLHLVATGEGISPLTITSAPTVLGPKLQSEGVGGFYPDYVPFEDFNGDTVFDGALSGATVAVGRSCGASTPVVTPSPAPTAHVTPTPKPGGKTATPGVKTSTPRPSGAPGTTATAPPGSGGDGTGEGDSTPIPGGEEATPRPSELVRDAPGGESNGAGGDSSNGSSSSEGNSPDNPSNGDAAGQASSGGSGSTSLILIIAGAFATLCVLLGATFLIMRGTQKP